MSAPVTPSELDLRGPRAPSERIAAFVLRAFAWGSIATVVGIVTTLVVHAAGFFAEVNLFSQFLGDTRWAPLFRDPGFGVWPLVLGTLLTTVVAMLVAVPVGLLGAIYLAEFASPRMRRFARPTLDLLAGIPTIVYGYFALVTVTPALQAIIPDLAGANALSAGLVMGFMIVPIIASLSEDAISAVPPTLREGALALGATRVRAVFRVIVPAASSGITAAVILGVSRAIGETMIVAIAAGMEPRITADPREPVQTMTAYIVQISMGDTPAGTLEHKTIFAVGLLLFLMTLVFNVIAFRLRRRLRGKAGQA
jgi:phosphate transport system permease protein